MAESNKIKRRAFNDTEKERLLTTTNGLCAHCGCKVDKDSMTIEHIFPISEGGGHDIFNTTVLCKDCNSNKSNAVYNIGSYYRYIRNDLVLGYEKNLSMLKMKKLKKEDVISESLKTFNYYPYEHMALVVNTERRNKRKGFKIFTQVGLKLKLEKAYDADAINISKFIQKCKDKYKYIDNGYSNDYIIMDAMRKGQVYILLNGANEIFGVFIFARADYINTDFTQLRGIEEQTGMLETYVMTLGVIYPKAYQCIHDIMYTFFKNFAIRHSEFIMFNVLGNNNVDYDIDHMEVPVEFNNQTGYLQFATIKGVRQTLKDKLWASNRLIPEDLRVPEDDIDELIDKIIYDKPGLHESLEYITEHQNEVLQKFMALPEYESTSDDLKRCLRKVLSLLEELRF